MLQSYAHQPVYCLTLYQSAPFHWGYCWILWCDKWWTTTMAASRPWRRPERRHVQPDLSIADLHTGHVTYQPELQCWRHGAPVWQLSSQKDLMLLRHLFQPAKWGTMYWMKGSTLHWRSAGIVCKVIPFQPANKDELRSNGHRRFWVVWSRNMTWEHAFQKFPSFVDMI